mmetsp:Transcript_8221/g.19707  ORF Transcript_8221/g.19707 Transcript_8221/m.19707 type:complete len:93 (-) Transcript_8221:1147-1425(-)
MVAIPARSLQSLPVSGVFTFLAVIVGRVILWHSCSLLLADGIADGRTERRARGTSGVWGRCKKFGICQSLDAPSSSTGTQPLCPSASRKIQI